jgi:hypothetical protein
MVKFVSFADIIIINLLPIAMTEKLEATYKDGTFIPQVNFLLPNNTEVDLSIYRYCRLQSDIIDPEARKEILSSLLERMEKRKN